jgi:membrane protease subunit HflK
MSWGQKGNTPSGGNPSPWGTPPKPSNTPKPNNSGGGSGNSGGGNNGNNKTPPNNEFEDLLRKGQDNLKNMLGGGNNDDDGKKAAILMAILGGLLWLVTGVYVVQADEQGVVLRFGEYQRTEMPGLRYHLPWPFEVVYTPLVTTINKAEIGAGNEESLMLTGDLNIVDVNFAVQWKIDSSSTDKFLFNLRDAEQMVKPVAESAMREVIGQMPLDKILKTGQAEIADRSKEIMQQIFDDYQAGIQVVAVNLSKPDVPKEVIDAFQDVKRGEQDNKTLINKAESYRNQIVPVARGKAGKIEQEALAYQKQVTEQAKGDAARFLSVYEQYVNAKDVTRKRMYLETMEQVIGNMDKVLVDNKGGQGVVPYFPLRDLKKQSSDTGVSQ